MSHQGGTLGADFWGLFLTRFSSNEDIFRAWSDRFLTPAGSILTYFGEKCGLISGFYPSIFVKKRLILPIFYVQRRRFSMDFSFIFGQHGTKNIVPIIWAKYYGIF